MNFQVRGKNIEVTPALRDYVEKRLTKLEKFFDGIIEVQVTLSVEGDRQKVEVTVPAEGLILRAEESNADMYSSIDLVSEKLERQIDKYKTKLTKRLRNAGFREFPMAEHRESDEPKVLRSKRFALKPMPTDEAIMQMNLLGHNFFMFTNSETEEVNVVYKRKDGNYGLIEPEYA